MKLILGIILLIFFSGCSFTITKTEIKIQGEGNKIEAEVLQEQSAETLQEIERRLKGDL